MGFLTRLTSMFRSKVPASPRPRLGQFTKRQGGDLLSAAWRRIPELEWLGPYTPFSIPHRIRKAMRRDPQIQLGMTAIKAPFYGIEYRARGGSPAARAFVSEVMLNSPIRDKLLRATLNALDFGFQSMELVWCLDDVTIDEDGPGGQPPREMPSSYVIRKLVDHDPERVGIAVDSLGDIEGIVIDQGVTLPADKVVVASFCPEFQDWQGRAVLDPAYQSWRASVIMLELALIWFEQKANPPLVGYAPTRLVGDEDATLESQVPTLGVDVMLQQAMNLRGGAAAVLPSDRDADGNREWELSELATSTRADQYLQILRYFDDLKLRGVLVPERLVSQEGVGSYASVDVHFDVFMGLMEIVRRDLVLQTFQDVADRLVEANFGRKEPKPRIESSELNRQSRQLLADILKQTLEIPRTLDDGASYTTAEIIDDIRALEALNIPTRDARTVARPSAPTPSATDLITSDAAAAAEGAGVEAMEPGEERMFDLDSQTVAKRFGVGPGTVRRWVRALGCPARALPGSGRLRFNAKEVEEWLEELQGQREPTELALAAIQMQATQSQPPMKVDVNVPEPKPAQVSVAATVDTSDLAEKLAAALRASPAPEVNVSVPRQPAPKVEVTVPVPDVEVNPIIQVPEQPPPMVEVRPEITVEPKIEVQMPEPKPTEKTVELIRVGGRIEGTVKEKKR